MDILAVHVGHTASALLMRDGQVVRAVAEEKLDNVKGSWGFPEKAVAWLLAQEGLSGADLDRVAVCGTIVYPANLVGSLGYDVPPGPRSLAGVYRSLDYRYASSPLFRPVVAFREARKRRQAVEARAMLLEMIESACGVGPDRVEFVEHHACHAHAPVMFHGDEVGEWLVLTMDGMGDELFATVNVWSGGEMRRIAESNWQQSLGWIYMQTTEFLGMKPNEHEYKVMGLAAYAKPDYVEPAYRQVFDGVAWLRDDGSLSFESRFPLNRFDIHLRRVAVGLRFDNLAGALQRFLEERVLEWAAAAIEKTGIADVMASGGVFMNVKLNKRLQELPGVRRLRVMPSCGDETNPFGAAATVARTLGEPPAASLRSLYLGHSYSDEEVDAFIEREELRTRYSVERCDNIETCLARMLADGEVVARVAGRAEFGARSLGNRAILANPSDMRSFYAVNDQIKARDFWMPFAPSILDSDAQRYLDPPPDEAPYMITAFDTTPLAREHLRAAMHQGDGTVRPQILTEEANPRYYRLLREFRELTGIGGVLNTSLNVHGYPLAATLEQALFTFESSGLQRMALESFLVSKGPT